MEQGVCVEIIHRSEPLPLEDAPKRLGNIEMRAIRKGERKGTAPASPIRGEVPA